MRRVAPVLVLVALVGALFLRPEVLRRWRERDSAGVAGSRAAPAAETAAVSPNTPRASAQPSVATSVASVRPVGAGQVGAENLRSLTYAQAWAGPQPAALAEFRDWVGRFRRTDSAATRAALEAEGLVLARARRGSMRALMAADPAAALALTIPDEIRRSLPAAIRAELETRFSIVGDFSVMAVDYSPVERDRRRQAGRSFEPYQRFVALNGEDVPAAVYGRRVGETTKRGIPLHGVVLDGLAALHEGAIRVLEAGEPGRTTAAAGVDTTATAEVGGKIRSFASAADLLAAEARIEAAESGLGPLVQRLDDDGTAALSAIPPTDALPPTAWTTGDKKVLIIRVDFYDAPGDPSANGTTYTAAYVQHLADTQVSPYFLKSSYGKVTLTHTVTTQLYRLPGTATYYATNGASGANRDLHADAQALAAQDYPLANYDRIVVLFRWLGGIAGSKITYTGLADLGGARLWINGPCDFRGLAHELGHTFGLYHANLWQVNDGNPISANGASTEYGDDFDTMGANQANDPRTDFNPWFKHLLGWVADSQVQTIAAPGTYRVHRFDNSTGTGVLALKILRDATRSYWVGVRRNFSTNPAMKNGAYVIWGYSTNQPSNLLDLTTPGTSGQDAALAVGATLSDPSGNVSIRPIASGGLAPDEHLDLQITAGVNGAPWITEQPQGALFVVGGTVRFSVAAAGADPLTYQWRKDGVPIAGATEASYLLADARRVDAGGYTVQVGNSAGASVTWEAILRLGTPPVLTVPPPDLTVAEGESATFSVGVTSDSAPTYQWRKDGIDLVGATGATLTIDPVQSSDAGRFDVVVGSVFGRATSAAAILSVQPRGEVPSNDDFANAWTLPGNAGRAIGPNIGATGETGEPSHYTTGGSGGLSSSIWFRWTPSSTGAAVIDTLGSTPVKGSVFDTVLAVYTGNHLVGLNKLGQDDDNGDNHTSRISLNVTAGTTYAIVVGGYAPANRGSVMLNYAVISTPVIVSQPEEQRVGPGQTATFAVAAVGTGPLRYQWTRNGADLPGETGASLILANVQLADVADYAVVVSNARGSVTSASGALALWSAPVIATPPSDQLVTEGDTASFGVIATGSPPPTYQWRREGASIAGASGATLMLAGATAADAGVYDVVVTNDAGAVTSPSATLAVNPGPANPRKPTIRTEPVSQTVTLGQAASFTVVATGLPTPTYQWQKGAMDLAGATSATLTLSDVAVSAVGSYRVIVTNSAGTVTSVAASLAVEFPPTITTQPASQTRVTEHTAVFNVAVTGHPTPTYQWRKDGVPIAAKTGPMLSLANLRLADAGNYDVLVTNSLGSLVSATATLIVQAPPTITTQPLSRMLRPGQSGTFTVVAAGTTPLSYQWQKNGVAIAGATSATLTLDNVQVADAAQYGVVVTNPADSVTSRTTALVLVEANQAVVGSGYVAGGTVTITNTLTYTGRVSTFLWEVLLPEGWSYASGGGQDGILRPDVGTTLVADWAWQPIPVSPISFTYTLNVPAGQNDVVTLRTRLRGGIEGWTVAALVLPDPLTIDRAPTNHSADTNRDGGLSLSELLRVIELYNTRNGMTRTGRYVVRAGTEDGFTTDPLTANNATVSLAAHHSGDSNHDGKLSLTELLRVIELYNTRNGTTRTGHYHLQAGTEDGFGAGP